MGYTLLPIGIVKDAELTMINELGGVQLNSTKESLISDINSNIRNTLQNLDGVQLQFLSQYFPEIKLKSPSEVEIPFLNLKPKIHKLSVDDIVSKLVERLKFRPVVDQSRWIFDNVASILSSILTAMKEEAISKFGGRISKIFVKSGHEVAQPDSPEK